MTKLIIIFRRLKKYPDLSLINILGMALGLVAAGIIFCYIYQEYNYDKGNPGSDRIYQLIQDDGENSETSTYGPLAYALSSDFPEIETAVRVSFYYGYLACHSAERKFNENSALFADSGFFKLFSFPLSEGNPETCLNSPHSIVLSARASKKYFGNEDPLGKNFRVGDDDDFIVTGVFRDFQTNSNFTGDLVLPLSTISDLTQVWIEPSWKYGSDVHTFLLLKKNSSIDNLREKARDFISKFIPNSKIKLSFQPLKEIHVDNKLLWESRPQANVNYLNILALIAVLTLFISIANFLFLYLGMAEQESTVTGIKSIFGASRFSIFLGYFSEAAVFILMSLVVSVLFFMLYDAWLTNVFSFLPEISLTDLKIILILFISAAIVILLSGIYPSLVLTSRCPVKLLNRHRQFKPGKFSLAGVLVVFQFSLCISLIAAAVLVHKQVRFMENHKTGYAKEQLITIPLNMHVGEGIYNEKFGLFVNELKKYPGILNASLSFSSLATVITDAGDIRWEGKPDDKEFHMCWESVSYDYFHTIGVKIIEGRSFSRDFPGDQLDWDKKTCAFMLNESAVKAMGIENPLGKEFKVWGQHGPIIGVVEDYNFKSLHSAIGPMFYQMNPFFLNEIIVRFDPQVPSVSDHIKTVWNKFVPEYPLEIKYVSNQVRHLYKNDRDLSKMLIVFSFLSILIACAGLFALTVLAMNRKVKEIGIRKVAGAGTLEVMTMLVKGYVKKVALALLIAVPVSLIALNHWLENFAYRTNLSWWVFMLSGLVAAGIALITVSWKSRQAAVKNPADALKYE